MLDTFEAAPADEDVWVSLRGALAALLAVSDMAGEPQKRGMRVLSSTPALRARNFEKHLAWVQQLTPTVAERLQGEDREMRAQAIIQAAIGCFETALNAWALEGEERTPKELLEIAFAAVPGR